MYFFCRLFMTVDLFPHHLTFLSPSAKTKCPGALCGLIAKIVKSRNTLKIPRFTERRTYLATIVSDRLPPHQTHWTFVFRSSPSLHRPIHPDNIPKTPSSGSARYAC